MEQFFKILVVVVLAILGGGPTLFILLSCPGMFLYKLYRKIRFGTSMMD